MSWFLQAMRQYATFTGRARRPEYWYFVLIYIVIYFFLSIGDAIVGTFDSANGVGLLGGLFALAMLLPSIGVTVRRLHDTERSGWWILISFVPLVGAIVMLVFMCLAGTPGDNRFGAEPATEPD